MTVARHRLVAFAGVAVLAIVALVLLLRGGDSYVLHARFADAGQLVRGADVQIAGRKVGSIKRITIARDGHADVELNVTEGELTPLHEGTRAIIRAVGQAGVANRYVQLTPGPQSTPALRSGTVLGVDRTTGIVDLDAVLDTLGPKTRADLQALIANSASIYAGSGAASFNRMLAKLNPAVAELSRTTAELGLDRAALAHLVDSSASAATAIASRRPDLRGAITNTATTMTALAQQRRALADGLERAPTFLAAASHTLSGVRDTVGDLRPTLRDVPAAARPLTAILGTLPPTLRRATPAVGALSGQLPAVRTVLNRMPALTRVATPALRSTATGLKEVRPIVRGLRIYGSDFILGIFNGLAGIATGNYNTVGHYARLEFVQSPQTFPAGALSAMLAKNALVPGVLNTRTGLTARCPGGMAPPSADGSSPWIPDPSLCNPADDRSPSVNVP